MQWCLHRSLISRRVGRDGSVWEPCDLSQKSHRSGGTGAACPAASIGAQHEVPRVAERLFRDGRRREHQRRVGPDHLRATANMQLVRPAALARVRPHRDPADPCGVEAGAQRGQAPAALGGRREGVGIATRSIPPAIRAPAVMETPGRRWKTTGRRWDGSGC
eukprot:gene15756-biopygen5445